MKVFVVLSAVFLAALAEPPRDYNFGMQPPAVSAPSASYGGGLTAARFSEFGSRTPHHFSSQQDDDYSSASSYDAPTTSYGAPSAEYGTPNPSNQYLPPSSEYGPPSSKYGPPSSEYGAPPTPSSQYGAPSKEYLPPSSEYGAPKAPSQKYGAPAQKYGAPSQKYGAPKTQFGSPVRSYNSRPTSTPRYPATPAPFNSYSRRDEQSNGGPYPASRPSDDMSEPASYEFKYEVNDAATGQEFGHGESREGDVVRGEYRVLLSDGRTQVVSYVADRDGYRPTITYLQPASNPQGPY